MSLHTIPSHVELDSPLDALEDLLPSARIALPSASAPDTFDLDALLSESMRDRQAHTTVKESRVTLAKGGLAADERATIEATIRTWEMRCEWLPAASVVMFTRQQCQCCQSFTTQFMGFFQRQTHRHTKASRWIASVMPCDELLPREAKYQDSHAELCENCAEHLGFDVEEA